MLFIEYPNCSTCQQARKFLGSNYFKFESRNIVLEKLNTEELDKIIKKSKKDINKFFNTSGLKYRELGLKNKLKEMSYDEKLKILSSDGMLVKRPILICSNNILIGFKQKEWEEIQLKFKNLNGGI